MKTDQYEFHVQYMPYSKFFIDTFYVPSDPDGRKWRRSDLPSPHPRPNLTYEYKGWSVSKERREQLDCEGRLHYPTDPNGRIQRKRCFDEIPGQPRRNAWDENSPIHALPAERLGNPTQKPLPLLERTIIASSNEGDRILAPYCGCGTTIPAELRSNDDKLSFLQNLIKPATAAAPVIF